MDDSSEIPRTALRGATFKLYRFDRHSIEQPKFYKFNICEKVDKLSNVLRLFSTLNDEQYGWE